MRCHALVLGALASLALAAAIPSLEDALDDFPQYLDLAPRQDPGAQGCAASGLHIIGASGDGSNNDGVYGLIGSLVSNVSALVPGSSNVSLPYHKGSSHSVWATQKGSENLLKYIKRYHAACPKDKITLLGYSAGAIITMNAVCGASSAHWRPTEPMNSAWNKTIISVVAYGDETFTHGMPGNEGTCATGESKSPRSNPGGCDAFAVQNYCNGGDPRCCQGWDPEEHFTYFADYNAQAAQFVADNFNAAVAAEHPH